MRASRTDKKVSAIMNVVSCKLHKYEDKTNEDVKLALNQSLPSDIKIFKVIEVSRNFNSKDSNNFREYHYILPTFCLEPITSENKDRFSSSNNSLESYRGNYDFRITPELMEKVKKICVNFKGTRNYHNYTRRMNFPDPKSKRHIYEISVDELISYDKFEAIRFKIIGQSFLYNQIRKIIGMFIDVCRNSRDFTYLDNTFMSNKFDVPKAPAEGLYLNRVSFYF